MNASWLDAVIGADAAGVVGFLIAALAIFLGIWGCLVFFRRKNSRAFKKSVRRENHRISVRDIITIDSRRRLILIRRDNVEHLLLTGGDSDLVVETFADSRAAHEQNSDPRSPAETQRNIKPAALKAGAAAERPAEKNRNGAENAYMARPQAVPQAGRSGNNPAERPRELTAEAAISGRVLREMPNREQGQNREARPQRQDLNPLYPPQNRQEPPLWQDSAERGAAPQQTMRNGGAARQQQDLPPHLGNREVFSASQQNIAPSEAAQRANGQNSPTAFYPPNAYPTANGHNDGRADMAEPAQAGNPFPSYPMKSDMQPRSGQNTAPQPPHYAPAAPYGAESSPPAGRQAADNGRGNGQNPQAARPIIADSYAPYLGYMPHNSRQPAATANGNNSAPPADMQIGRMPPQNNSRQQQNSAAGRPFANGQNSARSADSAGRRSAASAGRDDGSAAAMPQAYQNRADQKPDNGFDMPLRHAGNDFAAIKPAEENDFDKILQDELLRAPNSIKFPSSQKK